MLEHKEVLSQTTLSKALAVSRLVVPFHRSLCEAKDTCQLSVWGQISCLYSAVHQGPRNCAYSHNASHSQCKFKGFADRAQQPVRSLGTAKLIISVQSKEKAEGWGWPKCSSPETVNKGGQREAKGWEVFRPNVCLDAQNRRAGEVLKAFCFCSSRQFVAQGKDRAAGGRGGGSTLRLSCVSSNIDEKALATDWELTDAQLSSLSGSGGTSAISGLAAECSAPCIGPKKYPNSSLLAQDTISKQSYLAISAWITALHCIDGEGPN